MPIFSIYVRWLPKSTFKVVYSSILHATVIMSKMMMVILIVMMMMMWMTTLMNVWINNICWVRRKDASRIQTTGSDAG